MKVIVVLTILLPCFVQSARILGIFPSPGKSHFFLGQALMKALAEKGHDVTIVSAFGEKTPPKNHPYRDIVIDLDAMMKKMELDRDGVNMYEIGDTNPFLNLPFLSYLISDIGVVVLQDTNVQELVNSGEKFDIVIVEQFYNDAHKALAAHFGGIQVAFCSVGANIWINPLVGNPTIPSYMPDTFLSYSSHMTFKERLTNTVFYLFNTLIHHFYLYPKYNKAVQKYIPNPPNFYDVLYNDSLVLLNLHPSISQAVPHVPNMIEVGGLHVKPPKKLPQDLQKFLDEAKDGVIYFSMGSNLRSADLPNEKREAIVKVLGKLKQKVLWKWEDDKLEGQPPNVKLGKWLPQNDILAHPNVKLFITHGGLLSTTETIYHGKPVLAIPIFGDQKLNAKLAVTQGYGLSLPYNDLTERALTEKLNELLTNPKYSEIAKSKSRTFHDRQVGPLDTAVYWVEYVLQHKGAPHLKVAAVDLSWYQYLLLDVIGFLLLVSLISLFTVSFIFKKICCKFCQKKKQPKVKKN